MNAGLYTTPPATGEINKAWYGGSQIETYRQALHVGRWIGQVRPESPAPVRSKIISAMMLQQTGITTSTNGYSAVSATANCVAILNIGTNVPTSFTATASGAWTAATASFVVTASAASTAITNNPPVYDGLLNTNIVGTGTAAYRAYINTATVPANLIMVPCGTSTSGMVNIGTGTATSVGYRFGTSTSTSTSTGGVVDVVITVQRFSDTGV